MSLTDPCHLCIHKEVCTKKFLQDGKCPHFVIEDPDYEDALFYVMVDRFKMERSVERAIARFSDLMKKAYGQDFDERLAVSRFRLIMDKVLDLMTINHIATVTPTGPFRDLLIDLFVKDIDTSFDAETFKKYLSLILSATPK